MWCRTELCMSSPSMRSAKWVWNRYQWWQGDLRLVMPKPRDEVGRSVPDRRMRAMDQPAKWPTREVLDHTITACAEWNASAAVRTDRPSAPESAHQQWGESPH